MKHLKKIVSLLLTAVMVLAMCIPVMAAANSTPIDVTNHTFDAYQIFSGKWNDDEQKLEDIEWGTGVKSADLLTELKKNTEFGSCDSAASVAAIVAKYGTNSKDAKAFAIIVAKCLAQEPNAKNVKNGDKINAGYYLIVDTTKTNESEEDAKNLSLLSVGETVTITSKNSYPTVTKKVQDINDSTNAGLGELQDSADYDIGDKVPFTLTGTLPSDYDSYTKYKYVFHDTQSKGLNSPEDIVVKVDNKTLTKDSDYTVSVSNKDNCTFEIIIDDLKKVAPEATVNSKVVVTYKSELNNNATLGAEGNPNKVYLEYSNNPNANGEGETGKTTEDKVIVFTYKVIVNKYKNEVKDGNELAGATFTLEKVKKSANENETWTVVKEYTVEKNTKGNKFNFNGLDDGIYRLTETVTPSGYNTIDPIYFEVNADHNSTWENEAQNTILIELKAQSTSDSKTKADFVANTNKDNGKIDGSLTTNVVNKSGSTLPSTGGIGTTIFYVVGVILMFGAGVLLVTKKRMSSNR